MSERYEILPDRRQRVVPEAARPAARGGSGVCGRLLLAAAVLAGVSSSASAQQGSYEYMPFPTVHPHASSNPFASPESRVTPELLPQDQGWFYDCDSRLDLVIRETIRGAYMRVEYLHWDIQKPGSHLLGAPVAGIDNPTEPFLIQTPTGQLATAEVLSVGDVDFSDNNGIRGTLGLPFNGGLLEGNIWGLNPSSDKIQDPAFLRDNSDVFPRFVAVSLLSDGVPGTRMLLFDDSFRANYDAEAWGGDINLYHAFLDPREGIGLMPLFGFRYMRYDEHLKMRGSFNNSSGTIPNVGVFDDPIVSDIQSAVTNSVYSLQVGFRSDLRHRWFTVGVEPKLAFGMNDFNTRVTTSNLRDFDDPDIDGPFDVDDPENFKTSEGRLLFTPTLDLGFYAKIHLSHWAHLRVGYNLMLSGNIVRSDRSIYYNDTGILNPPGVVAQEKAGSFWIQGLTVGGEFILP